MPRNDVAASERTLDELISDVKKTPRSEMRNAITDGIKSLDVQGISADHRQGLSSILKALLREDQARSEIGVSLQISHKDDEELRASKMRIALDALVSQTIMQTKVKIQVQQARAALNAVRSDIKALQSGITDERIRSRIDGIVDASVDDDPDAIHWRIVILSLLVYQVSEAKVRHDLKAEAKIFEGLRKRMDETDRLVKDLFPKLTENPTITKEVGGLAGVSLDKNSSSNAFGFATLVPKTKRPSP